MTPLAQRRFVLRTFCPICVDLRRNQVKMSWMSLGLAKSSLRHFYQRTAKGASEKVSRQKSSKTVNNIFDAFRRFRTGQEKSKFVKKCQKYFRHFSTFFARHQFSGLFWEPQWEALVLAHNNRQFPLFLEDRNLLKLRSLDSSSPFFLSNTSIWGQWTQMLQMLWSQGWNSLQDLQML